MQLGGEDTQGHGVLFSGSNQNEFLQGWRTSIGCCGSSRLLHQDLGTGFSVETATAARCCSLVASLPSTTDRATIPLQILPCFRHIPGLPWCWHSPVASHTRSFQEPLVPPASFLVTFRVFQLHFYLQHLFTLKGHPHYHNLTRCKSQNRRITEW